jgi:hypothetical protein
MAVLVAVSTWALSFPLMADKAFFICVFIVDFTWEFRRRLFSACAVLFIADLFFLNLSSRNGVESL